MNKMTVRDIDVKGKRVLLRVDFRIALGGDGHITDDGRIRAAIPTIEYLVEQGAKVIIMSHSGRPDGKVVPSMSLKVTADRLTELMRHPVRFIGECVGERVENAVAGLEGGDILLLENLAGFIQKKKPMIRSSPRNWRAWARFSSTTLLAPPTAPMPRSSG